MKKENKIPYRKLVLNYFEGEVYNEWNANVEFEVYETTTTDGYIVYVAKQPDDEEENNLDIEDTMEDQDWIQKAVNPKHKGYCTPMTKDTCTPARKALAKRFKKAARKEKKSGGTGWEGKV